MKINVIGYSGAGKSTLTKFLAEYYHCSYLFMDAVNFEAGWKERNHQESLKMVEDFLENDSYVLDGNYRKFAYERRMADADQIIFLNFNRLTCFHRALKRYIQFRGKTRESSGEGCFEKFDFEFMCWILKDGRTKKTKARYRNLALQYPEKWIEIKNQKQLDRFYQKYQK